MPQPDIERMMNDFVLPACREHVAEVAREEVAKWREGVITAGNWCCTDMAGFASECFGLSRPQADEMYRTTLHWRGRRIRYCPFCGVHVSARDR